MGCVLGDRISCLNEMETGSFWRADVKYAPTGGVRADMESAPTGIGQIDSWEGGDFKKFSFQKLVAEPFFRIYY